MPEVFKRLQAIFIFKSGGDAVKAQVLAAIPVHRLAVVLIAAGSALNSGKRSGKYVFNVLEGLNAICHQSVLQARLTGSRGGLAKTRALASRRRPTSSKTVSRLS